MTRRVHSGVWDRVLPRVYRIKGVPSSLQQRALAASLWAGDGCVISHGTAGQLWEIPGARAKNVELWVPLPRSPRTAGVRVHRGKRVDRADRATLDGIPVTTAVRTLIDLSARLEDDRLLTAMEDVFRRGIVAPGRLAARLDALGNSGRPGAARLRRLLDERDHAPSESVLEAKVWLALSRSTLPRPVRQHWIHTVRGRYRLDFAWPRQRVAVEAEGWEHHGTRAAFGKDRDRLSEVTASGWLVLPVTWKTITRDPARVLRWAESALARTAA